jgi:hypothetical protein
MPFATNQIEFYRTERARLVAQGITDYGVQCEELDRRWAVVGRVRTIDLTFEEARYPFCLTDEQMAQQGVYLSGTADGMYMYKKIADVPAPTASVQDTSVWTLSNPDSKRERSNSAESFFLKLHGNTLMDICEAYTEKVSGNKGVLVDRIMKHFGTEGRIQFFNKLKPVVLRDICEDLKWSRPKGDKPAVVKRVIEYFDEHTA